MSTNTAGDVMSTCLLCGETYYLMNGHNCGKTVATYIYNPSITVEQKLDKVIELLESILKKLN